MRPQPVANFSQSLHKQSTKGQTISYSSKQTWQNDQNSNGSWTLEGEILIDFARGNRQNIAQQHYQDSQTRTSV